MRERKKNTSQEKRHELEIIQHEVDLENVELPFKTVDLEDDYNRQSNILFDTGEIDHDHETLHQLDDHVAAATFQQGEIM